MQCRETVRGVQDRGVLAVAYGRAIAEEPRGGALLNENIPRDKSIENTLRAVVGETLP
jgi:hypothetical protein